MDVFRLANWYSTDIIVGKFAYIFYKDNFSSFQAADFCSLHRGVSGSTFYGSDIPFHHSSACWCADHFPLWTLSECTIISWKRMFKKKWSSPMAFLLCVNSWRNVFGWESWMANSMFFHIWVNVMYFHNVVHCQAKRTVCEYKYWRDLFY